MKFTYIKNRLRQREFIINEIQCLILKYIFFSEKFSLNTRLKANLLLSKKKKSLIRISRRCFLTQRNRGVIRFFGLSRIQIRDSARFNLLPFIKKASW